MNRDELWNLRFQQLLAEYKQTHDAGNNCIVLLYDYAPNKKLGRWVQQQRRLKRQKKISVEREKKLNAIGFVWKVRSRSEKKTQRTDWNTRFQQLEEYKKANGDCNVSTSNSSQHIDLGRWVFFQRCRLKNAQLSEEREAKLNSIGFVWTGQKVGRWALRFQQLLEYKQAFGHCHVPCHFSCNRQLGQWVHNQRRYNNKTALAKER
jgi:hypothetical protein